MRALRGAGLGGARSPPAIAGAGVVLLFDPFTSWARQFAGGLSEPLLVALVLGAIDRGSRAAPARRWPRARRGAAAPRGVAAAGRLRDLPVAARAASAAAMLGGRRRAPDAVAGARPARLRRPAHGRRAGARGQRGAAARGGRVVGRSLELPLAALWAGAVAAVASARRRRRAARSSCSARARIAWIAIVAVLAAAGYAGLPRFAAPAAAVACVLGGRRRSVALLARSLARGRSARGRRSRSPALAARGARGPGRVRAAEIPGELERAADYGRSIDRLAPARRDDVGAERLVGCPPVSTTDFLSETALAWELELPITDDPPALSDRAARRRRDRREADPDRGDARRSRRRASRSGGSGSGRPTRSRAMPRARRPAGAPSPGSRARRGRAARRPRPPRGRRCRRSPPRCRARAPSQRFSTARIAVSIEWSELL